MSLKTGYCSSFGCISSLKHMQKDTQYIQLTIIDGVTMPDGYVLGVGRVGVTLGQGGYTP